MTPEMWDHQCRVHIHSCYLYEVENEPILTDWQYDQHCIMLLRYYDELPDWYTARISRSHLETASGSGIEFTQEDIDGAHEWVRQTAHWKHHYGL